MLVPDGCGNAPPNTGALPQPSGSEGNGGWRFTNTRLSSRMDTVIRSFLRRPVGPEHRYASVSAARRCGSCLGRWYRTYDLLCVAEVRGGWGRSA